jgi:hypothetical protein
MTSGRGRCRHRSCEGRFTGGVSWTLFELDPGQSAKPILDLESGNTLEMTDVTRHQGQPAGQDDRGDTEVGFAEPPAGRFELGAERTVYLSGILVEGQDPYRLGEKLADSLHKPCVVTPGGSVQQSRL